MDTFYLTATRAGSRWLFSDGTTLPVVSGGSDTGDLAPAGDPAPTAEPAPAPEPAPVDPPATPEPAPPADPFDDPANATFERSYVERLRAEAAERRVGLKPYADAFEGYDDADRDTLLELARTLRSDPASAAEWMRQQADALTASGDTDEPDPADPDAPLTAAGLEKYLSERESKATAAKEQADQVAAIGTEAKALGFDPDTDRRGYLALLDVANNETGGDLTKAAAVVAAERRKIIDDAFAAKAAAADGAATTPPQTGGATEAAKAPETWSDVRKAALSSLNSLPR